MSTQTSNESAVVNAESQVTGKSAGVSLSPKQQVVKAIANWAVAAFAEEVTERTGKLAGAAHDNLKTYRKVLGIAETTGRTVVVNDRAVSAEKAVKDIREQVQAAFLAEDDAELAALRPQLKEAIAELEEASKIDRSANTLRSLELNCTGGQSYSYSKKRIEEIKDQRFETALKAVRKLTDFESVGSEIAAAMGNFETYETLVDRDIKPIEEKGKAAVKLAEAAEAEKKAALEAEKAAIVQAAKDKEQAARDAAGSPEPEPSK